METSGGADRTDIADGEQMESRWRAGRAGKGRRRGQKRGASRREERRVRENEHVADRADSENKDPNLRR